MSNKIAKNLLIQEYGGYCMMCVLKGNGQYNKMKKITYHHIVPLNRYKKIGIRGATTIGNRSIAMQSLSYRT